MKTPPEKRPVGRPRKHAVKRGDYRHTAEEVAALAAIRDHYSLASDAAAVREALLRLAGAIAQADATHRRTLAQ